MTHNTNKTMAKMAAMLIALIALMTLAQYGADMGRLEQGKQYMGVFGQALKMAKGQ